MKLHVLQFAFALSLPLRVDRGQVRPSAAGVSILAVIGTRLPRPLWLTISTGVLASSEQLRARARQSPGLAGTQVCTRSRNAPSRGCCLVHAPGVYVRGF